MDDEKSKGTGGSKNLTTVVIVAVVVGALGFFGGMQYQKSKSPNFDRGRFQNFQNGNRPSGFPGRNGNNQGVRPVSGEIVSMDGNTLTVKAQDGSSKIVVFSDSTTINKTSKGSKDDLKTGENIMVIGTEGTDGIVTALMISIGGNFFQGPLNDQPQDQN